MLMRGSFVVVAAAVLGFGAWALPWVPFGLRSGDYTPTIVAGVLLAAGCTFTSVAFVFAWAPLFRNEPLPEFLRVLFGANQLIRGRNQFVSRIASECRRARRDRRYEFSVFVVQHEGPDRSPPGRISVEGHDYDPAVLHVRSDVRNDDIVGIISPREIWVLILGANDEARDRVFARLERALQALDPPEACAIGASTFGRDGERPDDLLTVAAQRLEPLVPVYERAA